MSSTENRSKRRAPSPAASSAAESEAAVKIVYQGEPGANSHLACVNAYPDMVPEACPTFEDAIVTVRERKARYAMIPIENSVAGRVADVHHLLPESELYIVGEHFERIYHQLLVLPGTRPEQLQTVHSHTHALGQCRKVIREMGLKAVIEADTAGAARMLREDGDRTQAVIASKLAAEIYGLEVLRSDIEDAEHNTTRFLVLSATREDAPPGNGPVVTSFVFRVRNVPAALYKALGGFATNGVNMTKLESYMLEGNFWAAMFYADVAGHPEDRPVRLALEECQFFSSELRIFGVYPASPFRQQQRQIEDGE
jgi:prephenate dehydratase